jgi:tight adherence protein B
METEIPILILLFGAIVYFAYVGFELFSKGWSSYENKVTGGTEETLESMYLTIPTQHIIYLCLASFCTIALFVSLLFGNGLAGLILGSGAFLLPWFGLRFLKAKRDRLFGEQLVPALGNMGNALRAGMSLPQAIELIHQEMDNPVAQEFRFLSHELKLGTDMPTALGNLERRMPNEDLSLMVTAVNISSDVGGNLSDIFENIAETIRDRQVLTAKVKSLTAQGKMQGVVMCMIPVGLGTVLTFFYPNMMAPLYETNTGMVVLGISFVMLVLGYASITKLTKVDF